MAQNNLFRSFHDDLIDRQHQIDNAEQSIERGLNGIRSVDSNVTVQDLLQHLGIGDQALPLANQFLEQPLRIALVGVRRTNQIHGNIGVDQNHGCGPLP